MYFYYSLLSCCLHHWQATSLPYFCLPVTNWKERRNGGTDSRTSHDFEDIIYILDNNKEFIEAFHKADNNVQDVLKEMSSEILNHTSRNEIIECHINPFTVNERREIVIEKLNEIIK